MLCRSEVTPKHARHAHGGDQAVAEALSLSLSLSLSTSTPKTRTYSERERETECTLTQGESSWWEHVCRRMWVSFNTMAQPAGPALHSATGGAGGAGLDRLRCHLHPQLAENPLHAHAGAWMCVCLRACVPACLVAMCMAIGMAMQIYRVRAVCACMCLRASVHSAS